MTQTEFHQIIAMPFIEVIRRFLPGPGKQYTWKYYNQILQFYKKNHPELHFETEEHRMIYEEEPSGKIIYDHTLSEAPSDQNINNAQQFHILQQKFGQQKTREQKMIEFLLDHQPHHSAELNKAIGWDWRKVISNVSKTHIIVKYPAGKYKWYQLQTKLI